MGSDTFQTTAWSVVRAVDAAESDQVRDALAQLCATYWKPLYVYARRRGYTPEDAEDQTQAFFLRVLDRRSVGEANPERGRFRTFLLTSFKHFLADEWDKARALKRGGGIVHTAYDTASAEALLQEGGNGLSPDRLFDLAWARALLDAVLERIRADYADGGKGPLFETLAPSLGGGRAAFDCTSAAKALGMSEGAIRVALHRLRKRYRTLLREEVVATLAIEGDAEVELRTLLDAMTL